MKKNKQLICGVIIGIIFSLSLLFIGCQSVAKSLGGNITIELETGEKLEEITWKDDSLWYLTRPMREDEFPETHVFEESSNFGVIEGSVTIIETK